MYLKLSVLAQPGAASAAERNWSIYGQIHSLLAEGAHMLSTRQQTINKQTSSSILPRDHAHVLGKMQDAGWQADVEVWESDEDSDTALGRRGGTDRARSRERGGGVTYGCLYPPTYVFYVFLMYLKKT